MLATHAPKTLIAQRDLHDLLSRDRALTLAEIAHRLGVELSVASEAVRLALDAGYLDRDEFGRYAPWCRWPRIGL